MFLFKPKPKSDDLLPPPPPFPTLDSEESISDQSNLLDKDIETEIETLPEDMEFSSLVKDLNKTTKRLKKEGIQKKSKEKKAPSKTKKEQIKTQVELPSLKEDFGLEDIELPEELSKEELEFPDTIEEFDIDKLGEEIEQEPKTKPKEILEAEEEIKSAIEKIKEHEKPSLLKRLFWRNKIEQKPELLISEPEIQEGDEFSEIQSKINKAREALMKFDLENAKINYIELMGLYNKIKPEEQAKVYNEIKELYFERKSAEKLTA